MALEALLNGLGRPIPNVPVAIEPRAVGHSSSSLAGALTDTASKPQIVTRKSSVAAQPLGNNTAVEAGEPEPLPEVQIPQSRDQQPATAPRIQAAVNAPHLFNQLSLPSSVVPANPPYPTTAGRDTSTVPDDGSRRVYHPIDKDQLGLVQRRDVSNVVPNTVQRALHQPQASGWVRHYQPETSTPTLPKLPSVMVRSPRQADRSRLAKDILKQLGRPSGTAPAIPTRREYKKRKKAEVEMIGASAQPSTEPVVEPQLNHDEVPLLPEGSPVPDQVPTSALPANPPQENPVNEPPSLECPDQHTESAPHDTNTIEQDVDMDIQPSGDLLVPQPPIPLRLGPQQDPLSSLVVSESVQDEGTSAANNPPTSETPSSRWSGPPPGTEIIEISDDEEQYVVGEVTAAAEPMEVDREVRVGGAISKSLSRLSLEGDDAPVVVEMGKDPTKEPLELRSSQEPVVSNGKKFTEKKSQKFQPYVELPPLPDYVRQIKGKGRAPAKEDNEEGL